MVSRLAVVRWRPGSRGGCRRGQGVDSGGLCGCLDGLLSLQGISKEAERRLGNGRRQAMAVSGAGKGMCAARAD